MSYKAVLFDLDGTLLDTLDDLADSMNTSLRALGFPEHAVAKYRYFVGDGVVELARRVLPEAHRDDATIRRCVEGHRQEYSRRWAEKSRPYDGVPEMLTALQSRGLRLAVLSNKPDDFTRIVVAKMLPTWPFEQVLGARAGVPHKPDPAGALSVARAMALPTSAFLYLGDTNTDMRTAVAAGMFPIGALWGFRDEKELKESGARVIAPTPLDVLKIVDAAV